MQTTPNDRREMTLPLYGVVVIGLVLLTLIGMVSRHPNSDDRHLLLLPEVWQAIQYRDKAWEWDKKLVSLETDLNSLLSVNQVGDLLSQTQASQHAFERAASLVQEIDQTPAPMMISGLRELLNESALQHLEASRSALRWLNLPKEEARAEAIAKLQAAQQSRLKLEESEWIKIH